MVQSTSWDVMSFNDYPNVLDVGPSPFLKIMEDPKRAFALKVNTTHSWNIYHIKISILNLLGINKYFHEQN